MHWWPPHWWPQFLALGIAVGTVVALYEVEGADGALQEVGGADGALYEVALTVCHL
jgi:hypothetical protein